jgi:hypothetical protein
MQIGGNKENSGAFKVVCLGLPVIQSSDFDPAITRRRHDFPISVKCIYSVCVNCSFQTLLSRRFFSVDTFNFHAGNYWVIQNDWQLTKIYVATVFIVAQF